MGIKETAALGKSKWRQPKAEGSPWLLRSSGSWKAIHRESTLKISSTSPEKQHCIEGGVEDERARRLTVAKNSQLLPKWTHLITGILTYNIFGNYTI